MADPATPVDQSYLIWPNAQVPPNQALRQRLAMQLLGQGAKKGYPKNLGEGLTAIGDAIGDRFLMDKLIAGGDKEDQRAADTIQKLRGDDTATAPPERPVIPEGDTNENDIVRPPVKAADDAPEPMLRTTPTAAQPASTLFSPQTTTGLGGPASTPLTPAQSSSFLNPNPTVPGTGGFTPGPTGAPATPAEPGVTPSSQFNPLDAAAGGQNLVRDKLAAAVLARQGGAVAPNPTPPQGSALGSSTVLAPAAGGPAGRRLVMQAPDTAGMKTDIRVAPTPQPQQPGGAYVTPEPQRLATPPIVPMSKQEIAIRQAIMNDPYNPALATRLKPVLDQLEVARTYEQARRTKQWESDVALSQSLKLKREELLSTQDQRGLTATRTRQEIAKEQQEQVNPTMTEDQGKLYSFYTRGKGALADLGSGNRLSNFHEWYGSGMPVIGNKIADTDFQRQLVAAKEFAAVVLQRQSGQAVRPDEMTSVMMRYFPRPGDSEEVKQQKERMRENAVSTFRESLGKGSVYADRFDQRFAKERQDVLNTEMEGVPKVEGQIKRNNRTGAHRMWNGSNWVEVK